MASADVSGARSRLRRMARATDCTKLIARPPMRPARRRTWGGSGHLELAHGAQRGEGGRRKTETPAPDRRERSRGFARAGPEATGSAHSQPAKVTRVPDHIGIRL